VPLNDLVCRSQRTYTGTKGQPKFDVAKGQMEFLKDMHFSWEKIAVLLGISTKTLSRRRKELQINDEESFHSLTDEELVTIMQEIMNVTPGIGQMRMLGALKSRGIPVQRWRVRFFYASARPHGDCTALEKSNLQMKVHCAMSKCLMAYRWEPQDDTLESCCTRRN